MKKETETVAEAPKMADSKPSKETAKPAKKTVSKPVLKPKEIEETIIGLTNQGISASEIGLILRSQHGIPKTKAVLGKTISQILKEHKLSPEIPEDLMALIRRVVALDAHLQKNKKDYSAKRGYQLTVSKIRRLVKYYHQTKQLSKKWRYSIETARLLVK
ncbi:30S ribosomal protein S15 [Candidatus Micrarchaeota archaeon]|nr:30S ribosomal protein S15 [Candidatus Micrarchaeota archaeon]